jgi:hypothetical protein
MAEAAWLMEMGKQEKEVKEEIRARYSYQQHVSVTFLLQRGPPTFHLLLESHPFISSEPSW